MVKYNEFVVAPKHIIELFSPATFHIFSVGKKKARGCLFAIFAVSEWMKG